MKAKLVALIAIFVTNFRECHSKRYDNYTLVEVTPTAPEHFEFLQRLGKKKLIDVVFWKRPTKLNHAVHFLVNPADSSIFMERVQHYNVQIKTLNSNIQDALEKQLIKRYLRLKVESYTWDHYHTLEDIYQWLSDLIVKFPNKAELHSIGKSVEGRDIFVLKIMRGKSPKEKVVIEGGIHGNEWISTEFVTYLANQLLTSDETNNFELYNLALKYQWYLIPVLNPDGYKYSLGTDRMWRKNRRILYSSIGVDLNRNFDYSFGTYGASKNEDDDDYCGDQPFSEPETKVLRNFLNQKRFNLKFYFAFHAYGQQFVIPYSDRINHLGDYSEMENYGKQAVIKIFDTYGTKYSVGTFYDLTGGRISGNSASWVKKVYNVKYVYTILLRDAGGYGHALPSDQILPTCKEALDALTLIMTARPRRVRTHLYSSSVNSLGDGLKWLFFVMFFIEVNVLVIF